MLRAPVEVEKGAKNWMGVVVLATITFAAARIVTIGAIPALVLSAMVLVLAALAREVARRVVMLMCILCFWWYVGPMVFGRENVEAWLANTRHYLGKNISHLVGEQAFDEPRQPYSDRSQS